MLNFKLKSKSLSEARNLDIDIAINTLKTMNKEKKLSLHLFIDHMIEAD
jgi:hypothetical protein